MDMQSAVASAQQIASRTLAPSAAANDKEGRFSKEAVAALGAAGLLGLTVPTEHGGAGLGPRAFAAVTTELAQADGSVAMVYVMHIMGTACCVQSVRPAGVAPVLRAIAAGTHLTTLAWSERGSRSHFWAPVSRAERLDNERVRLTAHKSWVTSAGYADSYCVSALRPEAAGPTESNLYLLDAKTPGLCVSGAWDGMGLRANASAPMTLEGCEISDSRRLCDEGKGFDAMLGWVLPLFNLGLAAVALGLSRAATAATVSHLKTATFEHLGAKLGETLPTLRQQVAAMQIATDGLADRIDAYVRSLENPDTTTQLRALEVKAAAGDTAIEVTSLAMRCCGGAAFSRHTGVERLFRDAHAGAVMAPTGDVLRELIGKALLGLPLF
jgi:alkylation response protein AidB-like acyl-CoA dehydrogenase